jgi:methyl-accepting chemotaxis protein
MFAWLQRRSFQFKQSTVITVIAFLCILSVSAISYFKSKEALIHLSENQLSSMGEVMSENIKSSITRSEIFSKRLAKDRLVEGLFLSYESSFYGAGLFPGEDIIIDNPQYKKLDENYGTRVRETVSEYGLGNLLLVSLDGQVVMSSNVDYVGDLLGRSLTNGAYKETPLLTCFQNALADKSGKLFFSGYFYNQIMKKTVAFFCSQQFAEFDHLSEGIKKSDSMGIVITQLNLDALNKLMSQRVGMGETGQSYIVGHDNLLRTDFYINKEKFNLNNSILTKEKIITPAISAALKGESGRILIKDPNGYDVISSYQPIEVAGHQWAILTEIQISEILAPIQNMMFFMIMAAIVILFSTIVIGLFVSKAMVNPIIASNNILSQVSKRVLGNSEKSKSNASNLSSSADSIAASIQETVSTLDELSSMVNRNLENVESSTLKSNESQQVAQDGKHAVSDMVNAMNDITTNNENVVSEMNAISAKITEIIEVINEIGTKTEVINDIVFQTKLLSFNASVEAARAGEHGKGFAVVAEEVGSLAKASGKAASEISSLLSNSISTVESIVNDTNSKIKSISTTGRDKISIGQTKASECGEVLDQILNNVVGVNEMITEISHASNEQAVGIGEVTKAMNLLDEMSNNTASISTGALESSQELSADSESLLDVLEDLTDLVHGYQTDNEKVKQQTNIETKIEKASKETKIEKARNENEKSKKNNSSKYDIKQVAVDKKEASTEDIKNSESATAPNKKMSGEQGLPDRSDERFEDI